MGCVSSSFYKYLEDQTADDHPLIYEHMKEKYIILHKILGMYWDLKTTTGKLIMYSILLFETCFLFCYSFIFLMTAVKSYSWSVGYSMQAVNYLMMLVSILSTFTTPLNRRREFSRIHKSIATGMFMYDDEVLSANAEKLKAFLTIVMRYILLCPLFCLAGTVSLSAFMPESKERYINDIDMSLLIGVWFPFYADTRLKYAVAMMSQFFLCQLYIGFGTFWFAFLVFSTLFALVQMQRLEDSIKGIHERTISLMKMKFAKDASKQLEDELLWKDEKYIECFILCLKENIAHHRLIVRYIDDFQRSIGAPMLVVFITLAVSMGTALSTATADDFLGPKINAVLIGVVQFCSSFVFCYIGQKMTDYSENLRATIYGMKWYSAHKRISGCVKILMEATLQPVVPTACGVLAFNLETFATMTDIAYKYYNLLLITRS